MFAESHEANQAEGSNTTPIQSVSNLSNMVIHELELICHKWFEVKFLK